MGGQSQVTSLASSKLANGRADIRRFRPRSMTRIRSDFLIKDVGFDTICVLTDEHAAKAKIDRLMTDEIPRIVASLNRFCFLV
jgi:hypothetical protein